MQILKIILCTIVHCWSPVEFSGACSILGFWAVEIKIPHPTNWACPGSSTLCSHTCSEFPPFLSLLLPHSVAGLRQAVLARSDGTGNSSLVAEPFWLQGADLCSFEGISETFRHFRALRVTQVCVYPAE